MNTINDETTGLPHHDRDVLRRLADLKAVIAQDPINEERRNAWYALDSGDGGRVMVLAEHEGVRDTKRPVSFDALECTDEWARSVEYGLRTEIYPFQELKDDHVIEPVVNVNWQVTPSNYGVDVVVHQGGDETHMGSRSWDPPIQDLDKDFDKLRPRTFTVDRKAILAQKAKLEALFEGILPVRIRGGHYWTMGMTNPAIELIGLEPVSYTHLR